MTKPIWASSWDYDTYHIGVQRRLRRTCASGQSRQILRCSLIWSMEVDEDQTSRPTGCLRMCIWRKSLRRTKSVIISWTGSFMPYANNKGADQPAYPSSLISTFIICCLNIITHFVAISDVLRFLVAFVADQAGLSCRHPKKDFSRDAALVETGLTRRKPRSVASDLGLHCLPRPQKWTPS